MKSHTGERNYECGICFKKFLYSYNVVAHVRNVHEKIRRSNEPYPCKFCNQTFLKLILLKEHLFEEHQVHENPKENEIIEEEIYEYEEEKVDSLDSKIE